jgi:hypothetical protein
MLRKFCDVGLCRSLHRISTDSLFRKLQSPQPLHQNGVLVLVQFPSISSTSSQSTASAMVFAKPTLLSTRRQGAQSSRLLDFLTSLRLPITFIPYPFRLPFKIITYYLLLQLVHYHACFRIPAIACTTDRQSRGFDNPSVTKLRKQKASAGISRIRTCDPRDVTTVEQAQIKVRASGSRHRSFLGEISIDFLIRQVIGPEKLEKTDVYTET